MSKSVEEYHKEFDALYGNHEPNLSLSKVELAASEAAYSWQSDKEGLTLEMFPEAFKRGFLKGYEQAEKDTIERAVAWLKEHADRYIVDLTPTYPDAPVNFIIGGMCWEDLKAHLEEDEK